MNRFVIAVLFATLFATGLLFSQTSQTPPAPQAAGSPSVRVYLTAKGKTYHTHKDCMSLSRSTRVLTASEHDAQVHGMTLCRICAHRRHVSNEAFGKHAGNEVWAAAEAAPVEPPVKAAK